MYSDSDIKRSWIEVDLDQLEENYNLCKKKFSSSCKIIAVVKAEAYGHGDISICERLLKCGVECFAVSNINEAISLRKGGISGKILILGYTPIPDIKYLEKYDITQTIISDEYAELLIKNKLKSNCQVAIDTGMNRIGLDGDDPLKCEALIRNYCTKLKIDGIFTHLCVADENNMKSKNFTLCQINKFKDIEEKVSDLKLPWVHCMNSAGSMFYGDESCARLGIVLYGLKPDFNNVLPVDIHPILTWKSVIAMIKQVKKGECIGYGCTYLAEKNMYVATIATGYADGYRRELSNNGYILIRGHKAPIVGRICMDQFMVDVTQIVSTEKLSIGEEVILIGRSKNEEILADEMAHQIGTIGYEIVCGISKRVPRIYER